MNREEFLKVIVNQVSDWPRWNGTVLGGWAFQEGRYGQYVHHVHDPITIDDWNRAKIVPNTKVRIDSPEHAAYIYALIKDSPIIYCTNDTEPNLIYFNGMNVHNGKEIFIEIPVPNINARVLAEKVGSKHDTGKPLYNLIPVHAEAELVDVLTFGATKYAPNQWRNVPNATERYTAAAMRHLASYRMGETHDIESGKHHLAHAMCCLAFIIELDLEQDK